MFPAFALWVFFFFGKIVPGLLDFLPLPEFFTISSAGR